jgi:hypothetical protein
LLAVALTAGCGAREIHLDSDAGSVNVNSNPDAIAPGVSVVVEDQESAEKIAVDGARVYWAETTCFGCYSSAAVHPIVRSCLKRDCRSTITTYQPATFNPYIGLPYGARLVLVAVGDNVYWSQQSDIAGSQSIRTCPSTGCVGAPRVIASSVDFNSMAVDESHVYWTSRQDSAVFRLPLSGTGLPEAIALNETNPDQVMVSGKHVYWIERAKEANSTIKRVSKQGGEPAVALAKAQNQAIALSVDSDFVYWATSYSLGGIFRCPLSGCTTEPQVIAANQQWIGALAVDEKSIFWIGRFDNLQTGEPRAAVMRCPIDGCDSAMETLAVQIFSEHGMSMATDRTDLYWVAQGLTEPRFMGPFAHATIYRHAN